MNTDAHRQLPSSLQDVAMVAMPTVMATFGYQSPTPIYDAITDGTMIEPIKLSARCSRWLVREPRAVAAAYAAGKTKDQLRSLVADLRTARQQMGEVAA